jgi:hypothetical protein
MKNVLIYDALYEGCIDYIDLQGDGVECVTGVHEPGGRFTAAGKFIPNVREKNEGCVDNGYASALSHHTIHYVPGEVDARTGGGLRTVPEGELASVRLGNWLGGYGEGLTRGGFESVTYTHQLDSGAEEILLLKYAVVIEDPGHEPRTDQPVFMLELLDENDNPLSADGCGDANFVANTKELLSGEDSTWHIMEQGVRIFVIFFGHSIPKHRRHLFSFFFQVFTFIIGAVHGDGSDIRIKTFIRREHHILTRFNHFRIEIHFVIFFIVVGERLFTARLFRCLRHFFHVFHIR